MNRWVAVCAVVLMAACGPTPRSEEARAIVSKHLEACGGAAQLRAVRSIRETGVMTLTGEPGSGSGPFVLEEKRPNKSRVGRTVGGVTIVRAFDGVTGWVLEAGKQQPRVVDDAERRRMAESDFDSDLLDYEARGIAVTLVGVATLETGVAYKLKVISKHGAVRYSYLDKTSFLEVRRDYVWPDGSMAQQFFRGHKTVDGLVRPMTYENGQDGNPRRLVVQVQKIEVNPEIPDARFRMSGAP
jgi:hypothetical protein